MRPRLLLGLLAVVAVGTLARPSPASAHEFELPVVLPTDPAASADGRDGFMLAVRQSPDTGHPAGADAGDHLGDVDVDIVVIDDTETATQRARVAAARREGLAAVVAVGPAAALSALARPLRGGATVLVAATDAPLDLDDVPTIVVRDATADRIDRAAADRFARDFAAAYGRRPSAVAARAYDAGRLLDALVRDVGPELVPPGAVAAAARRASAAAASSDVDVDIDGVMPLPGRTASGRGRWPALAVVVAIAVIGGSAVVRARRVRRRVVESDNYGSS